MRYAFLLGPLFAGVPACSGLFASSPPDLARTHARVEVATTLSADAPPAPPIRVAPIDGSPSNGSSIVLAHAGDRAVAYLADADDARVRVFDADSLHEIASLDVGGSPSQIVMDRNGAIFASLRDRNEVIAIAHGAALDSLHVVARAKTKCEPIGLALTPDGATLLVASGWGHAVSGFRTLDLAKRFERDVEREPRGVVVASDGKHAFVSHAIGEEVDAIDLDAPDQSKGISLKATRSVFTVDEGALESAPEIGLNAGQGFAIAMSRVPAGRVFVPYARVRASLSDPDEIATGYGSQDLGPTEMFDVAVIDEDARAIVPLSTASGGGGTQCVLPRAAATTNEGELLVACVGSNAVVAYDAAAIRPEQAMTRAWKVASGPTGIAVDDASKRALVWSEFARSLMWIATAGDTTLTLARADVPASHPRDALADRGRILFHTTDARISVDARACASCHPDGRDDGLTWRTPDGPRNPPMLAGRLDHAAPYGWLGEAVDVPAHLAKTFKRLGGTALAPADRDALVAYITTMHAPNDQERMRDSDLIREGAEVFNSPEAACSKCHGEDGDAPDGRVHNVLSWTKGDRRGIFDTPSLRFVAGTAPYFHDGRYPTLRAVFTHTNGTMGQSRKLAPHELDALEAYVRTL